MYNDLLEITKKLSKEKDENYLNYSLDISNVCGFRKLDISKISDEKYKTKFSEIESLLDSAFKENLLVKNFNKVPSSTLKRVMTNGYEATIQGAYATQLDFVSNGQIKIVDRGRTDGIMQLYTPDGYFLGYGLIEYKRKATGKNRWSNNVLTHALLQEIGYFFRSLTNEERDGFKVFCIACEEYFYFINRKDIQELIDQLEPLIKASDLCPSKLYTDYEMLSKVKGIANYHEDLFKKIYINDSSMFNGIVEEMFFNLKYVA